MEKLRVTGGARLAGEVRIQGAKNAVLPLLGAVLLTKEPVFIHNCPHISDVENMCGILRYLGACCEWRENGLVGLYRTGPAGLKCPKSSAKSCALPFLCWAQCWRGLGGRCFITPEGARSAPAPSICT